MPHGSNLRCSLAFQLSVGDNCQVICSNRIMAMELAKAKSSQAKSV